MSMVTQQKVTETEGDTAYYIYRIGEEEIGLIHKRKIFGSKSKGAKMIKEVKNGDKILFCLPFGINQKKMLSFVGYGTVKEVFDEKKEKSAASSRKIRIRDIKYFKDPLPVKNVVNDLKFIKRKDKVSDYLKSEYKKISVEDFDAVVKERKTTSSYPDHLEKRIYTTEEVLMDSVYGLFDLLKMTMKSDMIEIKLFIKYLHKLVNAYGLSKSYEDVEMFYSENAWRFKFEHVKSKDVDKLVALYDSHGNSISFAYIKLM